MAGAFTWLNNLLHTFAKIFPRLFIVRDTHRGVVFRWNGSMRRLDPGLRFYWPVASEIRIMPVVTRSIETARISVATREVEVGFGVTLPIVASLSSVAQFRVVDVMKAIKVFDIKAAVTVAIMKVVGTMHEESDFDMAIAIQEKMDEWGMVLENFATIDRQEQIAFGSVTGGYSDTREAWATGDNGDIPQR